jgi:hypothetical protein
MKTVVLRLLTTCLVLYASLGLAVAHEQGTRDGPVLGDFFSDRALLVSGWSSEELAKILDDFESKYKDALPSFKRVVLSDGKTLRVSLPKDFPPDFLSFLVNYIHYPENFDIKSRKIAAVGMSTLTKEFDAPSAELGKKAFIYIPADDNEYDIVYVRVGKHTYSRSFTTMSWKRVEASRLSAATRALMP